MRKTGFKIDWTWAAPHKEIDTVWYASTGTGELLVASNVEFDAIIIADTKEEMEELAKVYGGTSFSGNTETIEAKVTTLHSLATRWRWFLYKDQAHFLYSGKGWMPTTIAEYPGVQARIAPDPMAMVFSCKIKGKHVEKNDGIVIGGDVYELIEELEKINQSYDDMEFVGIPLFAMAARHRNVWFRGRNHDLIETICRNPRLLAHHGLIDPSQINDSEEDQ